MSVLTLSTPDDTERLGQTLARHLPEGRTVMYLDGDLGAVKTTTARALLHALGVERMMIPAGATVPDAGTLRPVEQQIAVAASVGRKARMKIVGDRLRPAHRHRRRQKGVDAAHPGGERSLDRRVEMHHLR